jgi:predicted ArsR family transcriptional regulator
LPALSALDEPLRARLYGLVCDAARPVRRDEMADAAGIGLSLAAYHLDELARKELLAVSFARPSGRGGPGAGRPAKLYQRADRELIACVPPRDYELLAAVLVRSCASPEIAAAVDVAARDLGRSIGSEWGDGAEDVTNAVVGALQDRGYEPCETGAGTVRLRNCPFRRVAVENPDIVCRVNLSLVAGLLEGLGHERARVRLDPAPPGCCVSVQLPLDS